MSDVPNGRRPQLSDPQRYEIRIAGRLAGRWASWFDGMSLTAHSDGTTVLAGPVTDQSALHGLLRKLSDLGLTLVSVTALDVDDHRTIPAGHPVTGRPQSGSTS